VNNVKLYQQLALYFVPIVANMVFINMIVVVVRLYMFERRIREFGDSSPLLLLLAAMGSCVRVWEFADDARSLTSPPGSLALATVGAAVLPRRGRGASGERVS
jgi:hypothetical protein